MVFRRIIGFVNRQMALFVSLHVHPFVKKNRMEMSEDAPGFEVVKLCEKRIERQLDKSSYVEKSI